MSLETAIARFRLRQADLFRDEATVTRPVAGGTLNPATGVFTPNPAIPVYSGACLLRAFQWEGTDAEYGDIEMRLRRLRAKFPVDTPIVFDDVVVPSVSTYDSSLVGVPFRCTDSFRDGWQIARVCILEEITS